MVEEGGEDVYDIGYGIGNPCRYLQEVFKGFLKCLGLENQGEEGKERSGSIGEGGDSGGEAGDPSIMDPTDQPVSTTMLLAQLAARRRAPPKGPISSGGGGQTN